MNIIHHCECETQYGSWNRNHTPNMGVRMSTAVSIDTQLVKRDLMLLWFRISPDPTPDLLPSEKPLTGPLMCQARQAADRCSPAFRLLEVGPAAAALRRWEKAEHSRVQPGVQCLSLHARQQWQGGKEGFLGQMASRWCGSGRAPVMAPAWPRAHTESIAQEQTQQTSPQDCAGHPGNRLPKPGCSACPSVPWEKLVAEDQDWGDSLGRRPVSAVPPPWHTLPHLHTVGTF